MILFFDTETTGLSPGHIIQLSYIMTDGKNQTGKNFYFATNYIEPRSTLVHGITVEKLNGLSKGHKFSEYIEEIENDFQRADLLVAHNFPFDYKFMVAEFAYNEKTFQYKESFDTMRYFLNIVKIPTRCGKGYKYPSLSEFANFFGVCESEVIKSATKVFNGSGASHDARYDTMEMYLATKNAFEKMPQLRDKMLKYY